MGGPGCTRRLSGKEHENTERDWPEDPLPIVIVGSTATGKTAVAVEIAVRLQGEIVNADSMQVYRGMDIGTAKPLPEERMRVPFHLLDIVRPDTPFTVADWKFRAEESIRAIAARGRVPIICGGTGLYVRSLLDNWSHAETPSDPAIRAELDAEAAQHGSEALHARLMSLDPESARRVHPNDRIRIVRALEVVRLTGASLSALQARDRGRSEARHARCVGLTMPRADLAARIERRVDRMLANGFAEEVARLLSEGYGPELNPMRSLGYKEMVAYLTGEADHDVAAALIKQNTRRFAKRQQTWFRADSRIVWTDVSALSSAEAAAQLLPALAAWERRMCRV